MSLSELNLSDIITYYLKTLGVENPNEFDYGITEINGNISLRNWNVQGVPKPTISEIKSQLSGKVGEIKEMIRKKKINQKIKQTNILPVIVQYTDIENPQVGMMVLKGDMMAVYTSKGWMEFE